jgi:hypothetical protein
MCFGLKITLGIEHELIIIQATKQPPDSVEQFDDAVRVFATKEIFETR